MLPAAATASLSIALLLFGASPASAQEFSLQPRLESGVMYYDFELSAQEIADELGFGGGGSASTTSSFGALDISDTMGFISGGVRVFADRFFVDVSGLTAFSGDDRGVAQIIGGTADIVGPTDLCPVPGASCFDSNSTDLTIDTDIRYVELEVSAGYRVTDLFLVFGGYRRDETGFEADRMGTFTSRIFSTAPGFEFDVSVDASFQDRWLADFDKQGPFVGAQYTSPIGQSGGGGPQGILTANIAVAFLNGDFDRRSEGGTFTNVVVTNNLTGEMITSADATVSPIEPRIEGSGPAIHFGLGWRGLTTVEGLSYSVGVSGYRYDFSSDDDTADVDETVIAFRAGVAYSF